MIIDSMSIEEMQKEVKIEIVRYIQNILFVCKKTTFFC